jgi:hypothetical protein
VNAPAVILGLALAVALIAGGSVAAFARANALKRLAGVLIALAGAALALAILQTPGPAVLAVIAIALAYVTLGNAVAVRLQEAYGAIESDEIDSADQQDEPQEPGA